GDALGRLVPVHPGHADIHQHDIRAQTLGRADGPLAVVRLTHDDHSRRRIQHQPEPVPDELLVVHEKHTDVIRHGYRSSPRRRATTRHPRSYGPASISPSYSAARSCIPSNPRPGGRDRCEGEDSSSTTMVTSSSVHDTVTSAEVTSRAWRSALVSDSCTIR